MSKIRNAIIGLSLLGGVSCTNPDTSNLNQTTKPDIVNNFLDKGEEFKKQDWLKLIDSLDGP